MDVCWTNVRTGIMLPYRLKDPVPHLVWYVIGERTALLGESDTDYLQVELTVNRAYQGKLFICEDVNANLICITPQLNVACKFY